uniref:Uncharacterized protein n=1 Tax=Ananas comosus var. bracteatus TaxID=296719 RepID=A0A6V7QCP3_ANACO|nr:unnamed protein product [Ananas comosus var. bracteatus]
MLGSFHVGDYFPALSWAGKLTGLDAKLKTTMATASEILEAIVEQRLARSRDHGDHRDREPECFVDVLLSAVKDNTMGVSFGKENIKAIVTDLFGAGTDSTFDWELPNEMRGEELDMDEVFGQTVRRKNSLQLVAKPC